MTDPTCFMAATDHTNADHTEDVQPAAGGTRFTRSIKSIQQDTHYCAPCRKGRRSMVVPRTAGFQALQGKPLPTSKDVRDSD